MTNLTVPTPSDMATASLGEAALLWAASGWSVFPVVPRGKTPYAEGEFCGRTDRHSCGFHCATTANVPVAQWWTLHPDSNIGITAPNAFIVDEDRLGALIDAKVKLPRCPYQVTGREGGGRHYFLKAPADWAGLQGEAVRVTYRVPAVEVKGFDKGYVVAAPSIHATGARYTLEHGGFVPEVSDAVMGKLVNVERVGIDPHGAFIQITGGYELPASIGEGGRYAAIASYTAHLYNRELAVDEMWALVKGQLAPRFVPPLAERDLRDRFDRATRDMAKSLGPPKHYTPDAPTSRRDAAPIPTLLEDAALTEYDSTPVEWLWESWLPRGMVTIMDGNPGVSKSTLVADLVARLTRGTEWPDGQPVGERTRALWVTTEDDPGRVLRPRIEAAGGDPSMVLFVKSEVVFPAARTAFIELLVRRATEPLGLGMVVLDPLFSHIEASVRTIADAEMRRGVMNPLNEAAEAARLAILVVRHFSKDNTASAVNRGAGSLGGIVGAARALWTVVADPEDDTGETKAVGVAKLNYARSPRAWTYRVVDRVPPGWVTGTVSGIDWIGESTMSIEDVMHGTSQSHDAQPVLAEYLSGGPASSDDVHKHMKAAGYGKDATNSAAKKLGVVKSKVGFQGAWTWALPKDAEDAEGAAPASLGRSTGLGAQRNGLTAKDSSARSSASSASLGKSLRHVNDDSSDRSRDNPVGGDVTPSDSAPKNPKVRKMRGLALEGQPASSRAASVADVLDTVERVESEPVTSRRPLNLLCLDYSNHQSFHHSTPAGWVCEACAEQGAKPA